MSKSKKNVIDPEDILETYGADAARLFILSDSPPERDLEWTEAGIEGAWRFINKLHKSIDDIKDNLPKEGTQQPDAFSDAAKKIRTITHQAIKYVAEDIEAFHMNKAVARIRELANALFSFTPTNPSDYWVAREGYDALICLFNPMMPHLAEELWHLTGHTTLLADSRWPSYDTDLIENNVVTIGVQINGKVRATITIASNASKDDAEKIALAEPSIQKALQGQTIQKVIVVPGRIVNVVAG